MNQNKNTNTPEQKHFIFSFKAIKQEIYNSKIRKVLFELILIGLGYLLSKSIILTALLSATSIIIFITFKIANQQYRNSFKVQIWSLSIFLNLVVILCIIYFATDILNTDAKNTSICEKQNKNLHEQFKCDFDSPMEMSMWKTLTWANSDNDSVKAPIEVKLNQDFNSKSCFLSVYIPLMSQLATYMACEYLTYGSDTLVNEIKNLALKSNNSNSLIKPTDVEINGTRLKHLIFTRVVHIYHEVQLFSEDKDTLKLKFKYNNISPEFHSFAYYIKMAPNK